MENSPRPKNLRVSFRPDIEQSLSLPPDPAGTAVESGAGGSAGGGAVGAEGSACCRVM
jgi:hypothetical protein